MPSDEIAGEVVSAADEGEAVNDQPDPGELALRNDGSWESQVVRAAIIADPMEIIPSERLSAERCDFEAFGRVWEVPIGRSRVEMEAMVRQQRTRCTYVDHVTGMRCDLWTAPMRHGKPQTRCRQHELPETVLGDSLSRKVRRDLGEEEADRLLEIVDDQRGGDLGLERLLALIQLRTTELLTTPGADFKPTEVVALSRELRATVDLVSQVQGMVTWTTVQTLVTEVLREVREECRDDSLFTRIAQRVRALHWFRGGA